MEMIFKDFHRIAGDSIKKQRGIGEGVFWNIPFAENFLENTPLKILRKDAILFRKSRKNGKIRIIQLDLALIKLNYA